MQPTKSPPRKTCDQPKFGFDGKAVRRGVLGLGGILALTVTPAPAEPYTFESLATNTFIDGDDGWVDRAGQGQAVIALDDTGNGTKVVRHFQTVAFNQSAYITRVNDAAFSFIPFTGTETNAVIQFDANGEHLAMFALGCDWNGDGVLLSADGEIGPAFGVDERKFSIQEANLGTTYEDGFSEGGGDGNSGNDWYRIQLHIDFTADDGEGSATLKFRNLTDGDTVYQSVSGLLDRPLGMSRMHARAGPQRWNAMWLHLLTMGSRNPRADNLVPNANAVQITEVTSDGSNLILDWRGGIGPYQVQSCPDPGTGSWNDLGLPTEDATATVPITPGCGFFRVTKP
jgi:hypothetical protein